MAAQQADEMEKREEEERKKALELKEKKQRQRTKVLEEILETEKDYLFSLNLCLETFLDGPVCIKETYFWCQSLLFLSTIEDSVFITKKKMYSHQHMGLCFFQ